MPNAPQVVNGISPPLAGNVHMQAGSDLVFNSSASELHAMLAAERLISGRKFNAEWLFALYPMLESELGRPGELLVDRISEGKKLNFKDKQLLEELIEAVAERSGMVTISSSWPDDDTGTPNNGGYYTTTGDTIDFAPYTPTVTNAGDIET